MEKRDSLYGAIDLTITYAGEPCNPFDDCDDGDLSMLIARELVIAVDHVYEERRNRLKLTLR